ncbi:heat shock 70 kDa protein cognate, putative [Entamoeba dispar SAW760]|uniref:Heat shock 70 kDa protein cognate, putative n=1 Tax=Entamoeba dispar (strain ATCC PRA-260 / SAW760) TaxID=370354 RepID=B0E8G8_ENTDS|nr:heat shock 70 kDa protein cognate, putative [Entamoeba dispar SAW760]EDR29170.1 heat shock 70 kDa protein cognate, putative [Entamoeba dispar SAW760]|eukprot:EDR29170.1 heat shock 70 kDa protein cognate, putative [Entamoeba dispar SAW760]
MQEEIFVGIDLGTTFSCCHFFNIQTKKYECINYLNGSSTIPSTVDFFTQPVNVGIPKPTSICEVKRFIGKKFDDEQVQEDIKRTYYPYQIVKADDGNCSAIVLKAIKIEIQRRLNIRDNIVLKAVVTVPAYFDDSQKDRTKKAVLMAGFSLIRLLAEPSAAAYAYGLESTGNKTYLAFDLGGGTLDVTILEKKGEEFKFKATGGDVHLGGLDFDMNLMELVISKMKEINEKKAQRFILKGSDSRTQKKAKKQRRYKLRKEVEKAKIELSSTSYYELDISELVGDDDFIISIDRTEFEDCNQKEFDRCMKCVDDILAKTKLSPSKIGEVMLVGGSSQIPRIKELLEAKFTTSKINDTIDCNLVVSQGAARYAFEFSTGMIKSITEVTAHPIKMAGVDGNLTIVEDGTEIPHDHPLYVEVTGWSVQTELFEDDKSLGHYVISNIPKGEQFVFFVVKVEEDGTITVGGELSNGRKCECKAQIEKKSNNEEEITIEKEKIDKFFAQN